MKSVRFDPQLEARLKEAARVTGESQSAIIRQGVEDRCNALLNKSLRERISDVIGCVQSESPTDASKTSEEFHRTLEKKSERWR